MPENSGGAKNYAKLRPTWKKNVSLRREFGAALPGLRNGICRQAL
jgi:hypothetical protein